MKHYEGFYGYWLEKHWGFEKNKKIEHEENINEIVQPTVS